MASSGDDVLKESLFTQVGPDCDKYGPRKITIIGVGMVGMACGMSILLKRQCTDLVFVDVAKEKLRGEVLDLQHGSLFLENIKIHDGDDYSVTNGSSIVIITAGARQQPDESRLSLVQRNVNIYKKIVPEIARHSPNAILIVVSNPVDIMTYVTWKLSKFPRHRVIGSGTNLDSARFRHLIAERLKVSPTSVHGWIVGEHGDSSVPIWSSVNISGKRLSTIDTKIGQKGGPEGWDAIHKQVIDGAYDVIKLKGYTNWAIGLSCSAILSSIICHKQSIHPVSCFVKGQYGIMEDVCLSLPCVLNSSGVDSIVNVDLTEEETKMLQRSACTIADVQRGLSWGPGYWEKFGLSFAPHDAPLARKVIHQVYNLLNAIVKLGMIIQPTTPGWVLSDT